MANQATETATKLKLDAPEALQAVAPAEAAGLVPLKVEDVSELDNWTAPEPSSFIRKKSVLNWARRSETNAMRLPSGLNDGFWSLDTWFVRFVWFEPSEFIT